MSRNLTTNTKNESVASKRAPIWFAYFDFFSGPVRVWTGVGSVSWNGNTYLGLGEFGTVDGLTESTETEAGGPVFTLTGAPSAMISLVFADNYNGRTVQAWCGFRNLATDAIIADPYAIFSGRMERLEIDDQGDTSTIRVYAESKNYAPNVADDRRFNDADQQIDFPGDTALVYLASSGQKPLMWGEATNTGVAQGDGRGFPSGRGHML